MSIKFCSLSSGSSGNCQYVETDNIRILIDAGFSGKKIEELLSSIDVCPTSIDYIFVTHEHLDHIKGVGVLSRRYDIPIYANKNTWLAMDKKIGNIKEKNIKIFTTGKHFNINDISIQPINIFHDASEPVAYVIYYKNRKISILTDTGWVSDSIMDNIRASDLYLIESNHDLQMLKNGRYPWALKQRVMSSRGHLSNDDAGEVLGKVLKGKGETVLLGHLSKDNNIPDLAIDTVRESVGEKGLNTLKDIKLGLTYRERHTKIYKL